MFSTTFRLACLVIIVAMMSVPGMCQLEIGGALVTDYVWRGFDVLDGGPAIQPSISYSAGNTGLAANVWGSWAITNRDMSTVRDLDELDLTLSFDHEFGSVGFSAGYIYYNFPSMENWSDEYSTDSELYVGFSCTKSKLSPGVTVYYALNDKAWDGLYVSASGSYSIETETVPLDLSLSVGYSDQSLVVDSGISDVNLGLGTSVTMGKATWSPSFTLTYVPDDLIYEDVVIFWGSLGFSCLP